MKLGFKLRKISIKIVNLIRYLRQARSYFLDFFYENSFKKGQIKTLLTIQEGAAGDTYEFIGALNQLAEDYPNVRIYCLTRAKTKNFYKNPKLHVISPRKAENLIKSKKIDALISYGKINNFFKKKLVFNIPYRVGKLFSYKLRCFTDELCLIFKKIGFEIKNIKFYYTPGAEEIAKKFYKENKIKLPVFIHVGSGKTIRALREGKIASTLWDSDNWARVADYLIEKYNCTIIFTGVKEEKFLIKTVTQKMKSKNFINITGKFSIEEMASIVRRGELVIGVDSGMTHILSQIGIPVIILFAGNPTISTPHKNSINLWSGPKVCNNCRKYYCPEGNALCISKINVKDVLELLC